MAGRSAAALALVALVVGAPAAGPAGALAGASPGSSGPGVSVAEREQPERVITMAPNLTEIVFALGAGGRLVAVSEYSDFPEAARELPRLGGFINPDIEGVLAYRPDLVILRDYSTRLESKLGAFGVPVLRVRDEAIADVLEAIRTIGAVLSLEARAEAMVASIEAELETYRRRAEPSHRPRVLLVAGRSPGTLQDLFAPGGGTFLDELIRLAGGANLFGDSAIPYPKVSKEEIIARDPEVILESVRASNHPGSDPDLSVWRMLGPVTAVRQGRIHLLRGDHLLIPGPRLLHTLRDLERAIHAPGGAEERP
ncbi:MAG: helical backbone metal receptor [Acidobacteriota bacterium]